MKRKCSEAFEDSQQIKMIEKALKTGGFIFPDTVEQVLEFERLYGTTDIILPYELQEPSFLYSETKINHGSKNVSTHAENFAMAARSGSKEMPKEIQQQIIADIKKVESRRKRKS